MLYLSCLSSLTVRNEYCQAVVDDGGLKCLLDLLVDPDQNKNVVKEALRLIKTLAGNDNVKKDIQNSQGISIIINAMTKHIVSLTTASCSHKAGFMSLAIGVNFM